MLKLCHPIVNSSLTDHTHYGYPYAIMNQGLPGGQTASSIRPHDKSCLIAKWEFNIFKETKLNPHYNSICLTTNASVTQIWGVLCLHKYFIGFKAILILSIFIKYI